MPSETIQQLKKHLEALVGQDPTYQHFLDAVKNTEAEIARLHRRDNYGRIPHMTEEDREKLMRLHRELGMKAEGVLRSEADKTRRDLVKKLTALAAGNHRALVSYDPEKGPKTLPALLTEVRALKLDTRGVALKTKIGGESNSRQPITFLDSKGREFTGVFTPKREVRVRETLQKKLDRIAEQLRDPAAKEMVKSFIDSYIAYRTNEDADAVNKLPESRKIAALNSFAERTTGDEFKTVDQKKLEDELSDCFARKLGNRSIRSVLSKSVIRAIGEAVRESALDLNINLTNGKIPDNSRLDTRNAAMSAVADLLGVPNLLARSRPMKLILPDGKEVDGTFTQEAKGLDPENLDERAQNIDSGALSRETPDERETHGKAVKALADLQILDYLCGNVDRHQSNMFYQFDQNGKFLSVQGIDNDCAFGLVNPGPFDREKELPPLSKMKVISESMYNTVMALTPETLRFTLQGFGLSEEELESAGKRLKTLKDQLQADKDYFDHPEADPDGYENAPYPDGHIRVIKEDEWKQVKLADLELINRYGDAQGNWFAEPNNVFASADTVIKDMKGDYRRQKKAWQSLRGEVAIGSGNRAIPTEQAKEATKARKLAEMLQKRTSQGRSSPQYDAMQEAVEKYALFQLQLRRRMQDAAKDAEDPEAPYESIVSTADLKKMRQLAEKVRETADAYLAHKGGGLHLSYASKRIEAAKFARKLGAQGAAFRQMEEETAERNMHGAIEEANRRTGDKLEASGLDAGHANPIERNGFNAVKNDQPQRRMV